MGLDLVVEGSAKAGHEQEWRRLVERAFAGDILSDSEVARYQEISVPAFERVGAPRVGYDSAADAWIVEARKPVTSEESAAVLKDFHGYYVLQLVKGADGVPRYSSAGLYDGVDETSFRGQFFRFCRGVLSRELIDKAWDHKLPEAAVEYGRELLAAADKAEAAGPPPPKPGLLARIGLGKKEEQEPFAEQLEIVRAAGRWFVFWGERGHPIRAWS